MHHQPNQACAQSCLHTYPSNLHQKLVYLIQPAIICIWHGQCQAYGLWESPWHLYHDSPHITILSSMRNLAGDHFLHIRWCWSAFLHASNPWTHPLQCIKQIKCCACTCMHLWKFPRQNADSVTWWSALSKHVVSQDKPYPEQHSKRKHVWQRCTIPSCEHQTHRSSVSFKHSEPFHISGWMLVKPFCTCAWWVICITQHAATCTEMYNASTAPDLGMYPCHQRLQAIRPQR